LGDKTLILEVVLSQAQHLPQRGLELGDPEASGAQDAREDHDTQDPSTEAIDNDGTSVPKMVIETDTTTAAGAATFSTVSEVAARGLTTSTSPTVRVSSSAPHMVATTASVTNGDDTVEEPEVVIGHLGLGAPWQIPIPKVVDTPLVALQQARDVLLWKRRGLDEEQERLIEWGSLLKARTASGKQKAVEKWEWLDKKEALLAEEEITIGLLDAKAQEMMDGAKELYATAEACADANIKVQEDLNT
jgi:hypothetical protein